MRKQKSATLIYSNEGNPFIKIIFSFDHTDLKNVKSLPDRKFIEDGRNRYWVVPLSIGAVTRLSEWGFKVHPILFDVCNKMKIERLAKRDGVKKIKGFNGILFKYQKVCVGFIDWTLGRALVADDMGLGKTIMAIAWLCLRPKARKVLIIVPSVLKPKWYRECHKFMYSPNVQILSGQKPTEITGDFLIINHDILQYWKPVLLKAGIKAVIVDEIHYYKNSKALRTKALKSIVKKAKHIIGLSGTPIESRPVEIFNVCSLINPNALPNWWAFTEKYCGAVTTPFGRDVSGSSNTRELYELLTTTIMIRRKKSEVMKDLPPIMYSEVPIEITNRKEYDEAENDFITYMEGNISKEIDKLDKLLLETTSSELAFEFDTILGDDKKEMLKRSKLDKVTAAEMLVKLGVLKQLAVKGKMKGIIEWVTDFISTGEKLILFCTHVAVVQALTEAFPKSVKIVGGVSPKKRQEAVDKFQTDKKVRLIIINYGSGAEGLDLFASSNVAAAEYPWTPGKLDQAFARAHRIGQDKQVTAWFLNGINTIDDRLSDLIKKKREIVDGVLDGKIVKKSTFMKDLIKTYKR